MPKLKQSDSEKRNNLLLAKLKYYQTLYGIKPNELSISMRKTERTYYSRLKKPDDFTLGELRGIARKCHTTIRELLEAES